MTVTLDIKTADELVDAELEARWTARRAARQTRVLQRILRMFADQGGPLSVDALVAMFPASERGSVREAVATLDRDDLIQVRDDRIDIAYPFSAMPTDFVVSLGRGRERYACCAIDALGLAPMLGVPIAIRSRCHHCRDIIELTVTPESPGRGCEGLMVWVGKQEARERRVATSL